MDTGLALRLVVAPTLAWVARFGPPDSPAARALIIAIGWQESRFEHRDQLDRAQANGPALGFWQFECNGGTAEVLEGRLTKPIAERILLDLSLPSGLPVSRRAVWETLEFNDQLACAFARLLLWPDPAPLPPAEDTPAAREAAWCYYLRRWRPGKPHPETWPTAWELGCARVREAVS